MMAINSKNNGTLRNILKVIHVEFLPDRIHKTFFISHYLNLKLSGMAPHLILFLTCNSHALAQLGYYGFTGFFTLDWLSLVDLMCVRWSGDHGACSRVDDQDTTEHLIHSTRNHPGTDDMSNWPKHADQLIILLWFQNGTIKDRISSQKINNFQSNNAPQTKNVFYGKIFTNTDFLLKLYGMCKIQWN